MSGGGGVTLTVPVLAAIVLPIAIGTIILLAILIYCSYRVRTQGGFRQRKDSELDGFSVFVVPSPVRRKTQMDLSGSSQKLKVPVELKRYRRMSEGDADRPGPSVHWSKRHDGGMASDADWSNDGRDNLAYQSSSESPESSQVQIELHPASPGLSRGMAGTSGQSRGMTTGSCDDSCLSNGEEQPIRQVPNDFFALELERSSQRRKRQQAHTRQSLQYLALRNSFNRRDPNGNNPNDDDSQAPSTSAGGPGYPGSSGFPAMSGYPGTPALSTPMSTVSAVFPHAEYIDDRTSRVTKPSEADSAGFSLSEGDDSFSNSSNHALASMDGSSVQEIRFQHKLRTELAEAIANDQVAESSVMFSVDPLMFNNDTSWDSLADLRNGNGARSPSRRDDSRGLTPPSPLEGRGSPARSPIEVICKQRTAV